TEKGGLYVAATRYKSDDFHPYLYRTLDYGKTWTKIVDGIKADHFTRVIRADPKRKGLLYAGTERGMYISFDDGGHWQSVQLNLPIVPSTDLAVKNDDLVVATQGRSFWVLDDLTPLHQFRAEMAKEPLHVYKPRESFRLPGGGFGGGESEGGPPQVRTAGQNPPGGAAIFYQLKGAPHKDAAISVEILDAAGAVIRTFSSKAEKPAEKIEPKKGMNRFVWNLRYSEAESFPGMIIWGALVGPRAVPGTYQVRVKAGEHTQTVSFDVKPDPRTSATSADFEAQFRFL